MEDWLEKWPWPGSRSETWEPLHTCRSTSLRAKNLVYCNKVRWNLTGKSERVKKSFCCFFIIALIKNLREEQGLLLIRKIKDTGLMKQPEACGETDHVQTDHQEFFIIGRSIDSVWITQKEMMAEYIARGYLIRRALWKRWQIIEKIRLWERLLIKGLEWFSLTLK